MELKLEDLTKDELILLIRQLPVLGPSQRDMLRIRWDTLTKKGHALLGESIKAGEAGDMKLADRLYDESARVRKKADAVFAEMCPCPK
jgi:enoyl-CoA hydratase/carnithine racemase